MKKRRKSAAAQSGLSRVVWRADASPSSSCYRAESYHRAVSTGPIRTSRRSRRSWPRSTILAAIIINPETRNKRSLVQAAEKLGEIAIARLRRRRFEGAPECGGKARLRRSHVHSDDSAIHRFEF